MRARLSVIIPTLDEEGELGGLLQSLAGQGGVDLEVVVADGASSDATRRVFEGIAATFPHSIRWVDAPKGRARQMNAGARAAKGEELLFLHADTRLESGDFLGKALGAMEEGRERLGHGRLAGHFGVRFHGDGGGEGFYYFYEAKTFTSRPGTINGDQGLFIGRKFLEDLGGFDESLPFMEDARIERRIRERGEWILLPGAVKTSARRFEGEGRAKRQIVNALIRFFDEHGIEGFLDEAPGLYAEQSRSGGLKLGGFLTLARRAMGRGNWHKAGKYARQNAWQLIFAFDCLRGRRMGVSPGDLEPKLTGRLEPAFDALTDNPLGNFAATVLTFAAFYALISASMVFEGRQFSGRVNGDRK